MIQRNDEQHLEFVSGSGVSSLSLESVKEKASEHFRQPLR